MVSAVIAARSRQGRCAALPAVCTSRCWRLTLLAIVAFVFSQLLFFLIGSTSFFSPKWPSLTISTPRLGWLQSSSQDSGDEVRFLNLEEETDVILLFSTSVRWKDDNSVENFTVDVDEDMPLCPANPLGLVGPLKVNKNPPSLEEQERNHSEQLALGGHYEPENCTARHKVAIIIPYRDRRSHLTVLVNHLHPILRRQQLEYNIFVVEQAESKPFNRGMLMNVGFKEALNKYPFECIILHDVDLVPEDDRNLYTCSQPPRHMSTSISSHNYRLMYANYFGGVSAMTASQFKAINGFSNKFWGWGGEDDDLFNRVRDQGFNISRYPGDVGRYTMLSHKKAKPSPSRHRILKKGRRRFKTDGLNNLQYKILNTERRHLFTWILVSLPRK